MSSCQCAVFGARRRVDGEREEGRQCGVWGLIATERYTRQSAIWRINFKKVKRQIRHMTLKTLEENTGKTLWMDMGT